MDESSDSEIKQTWDRMAVDWDTQVGNDGDKNRFWNSDPVLWRFAGEVKGLDVLDAGCGTGYLSRKLHARGAQVVGVDLAPNMIKIAKSKSPEIDYRVDSCSVLASIPDASIDLIVSNYVLMDTPDLKGSVTAFRRVLRRGGTAIIIFSHPCFPQGMATVKGQDQVEYRWEFSYFRQQKVTEDPWAHFKDDFIWFHRPLSDYWKMFRAMGLEVTEFEEPRIEADRIHLVDQPKEKRDNQIRPYSVAFKLTKRTIDERGQSSDQSSDGT